MRDILSIFFSFFKILLIYFVFCLLYVCYQFLIYTSMSKNLAAEAFGFEKDQIRLMFFQAYTLLSPIFLLLTPFFNPFLKEIKPLKTLLKALLNFALLVVFIRFYFFMTSYFPTHRLENIHFYVLFPETTPFVKIDFLNRVFDFIRISASNASSLSGLKQLLVLGAYAFVSQFIVSWFQKFFRSQQELFMFNFVSFCILIPLIYGFIYYKI